MRLKILRLLQIIALLLAIYLIVGPFLPLLETPKIIPPTDNTVEEKKLVDQQIINDKAEPAVSPNKLLIPAINMNVALNISSSSQALDWGAWLKSDGARPGRNGNVIITGHKFVYFSGVRPFYHLYLTPQQANVYLILNNTVYQYQVNNNFIVYEYETWIEENTSEKPILTIYTCEGLNSYQRRVIRADFVQKFTVEEFNSL